MGFFTVIGVGNHSLPVLEKIDLLSGDVNQLACLSSMEGVKDSFNAVVFREGYHLNDLMLSEAVAGTAENAEIVIAIADPKEKWEMEVLIRIAMVTQELGKKIFILVASKHDTNPLNYAGIIEAVRTSEGGISFLKPPKSENTISVSQFSLVINAFTALIKIHRGMTDFSSIKLLISSAAHLSVIQHHSEDKARGQIISDKITEELNRSVFSNRNVIPKILLVMQSGTDRELTMREHRTVWQGIANYYVQQPKFFHLVSHLDDSLEENLKITVFFWTPVSEKTLA